MKTGAMLKEAIEVEKTGAGTQGPGTMPPEAVASGTMAPGAAVPGIIAPEAATPGIVIQGTGAPWAIDTVELIKSLGYPLHSDAIQRTKDQQTHKGYNTDGYGYQFCTDRFNEVLGIEWGFKWEIIHEEKITTSNGKTCHEITVKMGIWILKKDTVRCCVGGHISKSYTDALKGAITNAFKKTAAFWGVGRQAYNGALDDDNDPWPEFIAQNGGEGIIQNGSNGKTAQNGTEGRADSQSMQPEQKEQSDPGQTTAPPAKQAESPRQSDPAPKQPNQAAKQKDQATKQPTSQGKQSASTLPPNNGNGHKSGQQNGHTPSPQNGHTAPLSTPSPPAGNGREAGLRRRITAKLETIFGRSGEAINQWLQTEFKSLPNLEAINNLDAQKLETMLGIVEKRFEAWKVGSNN